jgi:hypothetical protein
MVRVRRKVNYIIFNSIAVLVLLLIIEGLSSYISVGYAFFTQKLSEREHTEYDEELGWINLPNVDIESMYGQGVYFTTNSQRYRNSRDFSREVPIGRIRVICSGDSFTLGFGVDNDHTWCQLLTALDKRLETVNLGQGGYGVDQAYLWYRRNETLLEHDIVLFAFISDDFRRMQSDTFFGYGKPNLTLRQDRLFQKNYPVPRRSYDTSWLTTNLYMLRELNTVKLLSKVLGIAEAKTGADAITVDHEQTETVASRIFVELQETSMANQRIVILVYLPTFADYEESRSNRWRQYVQAEANKNNYLLIDIAEEMRALPPEKVQALFRKGGHYSEEGNRYVAQHIYTKIKEFSLLKDRWRGQDKSSPALVRGLHRLAGGFGVQATRQPHPLSRCLGTQQQTPCVGDTSPIEGGGKNPKATDEAQ